MTVSARFNKISEIKVNHPETWRDPLFLTFDIDWAHDDVLADTIDIVEQADVKATWMVTHNTILLERLRSNKNFELGIHPNFNFLLNGDSSKGKNAKEVLKRMMEIVPEAKVIRSHSVVQSSRLLQLFFDEGLTHDCNDYIPGSSGIVVKPWQHWNDLIKVPFFYEDDVFCFAETEPAVETLMASSGLRVFNFHPIHVFLNTEHMDRYENTRNNHYDPKALIDFRNNKVAGTRDILRLILEQSVCA